MDQMEIPYQVRLEQFEGPLDLLLHLIKKNEVNIYDIPIALITQQYLDYLSVMKSLNLAVAGEFLVMAATLIHIKSRMLLPPDQTTEDDEETLDPRDELVRRLLEYKRFKEAAGLLDERERVWRQVYAREQPEPRPVRSQEALLEELTLFDLVDALQSVLARTSNRPWLEILPENLTVNDRMSAILDVLSSKEAVMFQALFEGQTQRLHIIVTFLALLELVRLGVVRVFQGELFGPILVSRAFSPSADEALCAVEPVEP
ncbi:segregation and condensation protein A [Nitrospira sp. Kam-Ns4a]